MSVKFKVTQKTQPGVIGGGIKKYYALPVVSGELTVPDLINSVEKISTVSGADLHAVVYSIVDISINNLENGMIVRLGDLGSLRVSFGSEGKINAEDINADCIKEQRVIFTPGKRIKTMLKNLKFKKDNPID